MRIVPEENLSVLKKKERTCCKIFKEVCDLFMVLFLFILILISPAVFVYGYFKEKSLIASLPRFSIEAVTASYINISSTTMPNTLSAQNLTIDFIVKNPAKHQVEYNNAFVSISYKEEIIWFNTLGLYHQEKRDRTSIQVAFGNWPVKVREIDNATITSGYGIFTVQVKANYDTFTLDISCGEVKINLSSFTKVQGPIKYVTDECLFSKYLLLSTASK